MDDEFKLDQIQRERAEALMDSMSNSYEFTEAAVFELIWRRDQAAAALSQPAAQVDSSHSAGGECGGVPQWRPIETAPKDGALVLAYWDAVLDGEQVTGDGCYALTRWDGVEWASQDDPGITFADPTHWMPLPTTP